MATYKVIQDIEAEDKLIGPLTLRQFIYACITVICGYLGFLSVTKHAAFMLVVFLPMMGIAAFFAWPWSRDQPTEIWALAKIRFLLKPRRRIWDQNGAKELVTVTAPKRVIVNYSNGLSQTEVRSRLRALADTIDSRGWAIKNVNVNLYGQPGMMLNEPSSDRLIDIGAIPQEVPNVDVQASDDILDEQSNPVAHQFDTMIAESTRAHRQQLLDEMHQAAVAPAAALPQPQQPTSVPAPQPQQRGTAQPTNDYWFLNKPGPVPAASATDVPTNTVTFSTQLVTPGTAQQPPSNPPSNQTADDQALLAQLHAQDQVQNSSYGHLHTIQPLSAQPQQRRQTPAVSQQAQPTQKSDGPKLTQTPDAGIIKLSRNDDLSVATLAREAHRQHPDEPQNEVVISLR